MLKSNLIRFFQEAYLIIGAIAFLDTFVLRITPSTIANGGIGDEKVSFISSLHLTFWQGAAVVALSAIIYFLLGRIEHKPRTGLARYIPNALFSFMMPVAIIAYGSYVISNDSILTLFVSMGLVYFIGAFGGSFIANAADQLTVRLHNRKEGNKAIDFKPDWLGILSNNLVPTVLFTIALSYFFTGINAVILVSFAIFFGAALVYIFTPGRKSPKYTPEENKELALKLHNDLQERIAVVKKQREDKQARKQQSVGG